jgi:hypothetical protein
VKKINSSPRLLSALVAAVVLLEPGAVVHAQVFSDAPPTTDLTFAGSLTDELTGSDTNACVFEDGNLRGQLAGPGTASILSFNLSSAAVGSYMLQPGGDPKVSLVTLSDDPNEFLINWYSQAGTLTISSLDVQVPVGDGSVSTKGASGAIDADISADKHGTVHVSGSWACHVPF